MCSTYLDSFIHIEDKLAGVTDKEDDDNGEEKSYHGGVAAVVPGHAVVKLVCSEKYPRISFENVRFLY